MKFIVLNCFHGIGAFSPRKYKGQYSGQNSLFFPHPEKGGSLFLPCFSRHFYGEIFRMTLFFGKICARTFQVSKFDRKRVFNARSAKFFHILPFKMLKIHEKGKKLLNNCKKYYQGRAYFFPVSLFFSKSLFLPIFWRMRPEYLYSNTSL